MRTATEFLDDATAPLSATLSVRPLRLVTFVPELAEYSWERTFAYVLAAQTRAWGGRTSIVVPHSQQLLASELFWRICDAFDPDAFTLFAPRWADLEQLDPDAYAAEEARWRHGWGNLAQQQLIEQAREQWMYELTLSDELQAALVVRLAPFHLAQERILYYLDGVGPPEWPSTDVTKFATLPERIVDLATSLGELEQLMVTARWGQLLPSMAEALRARGVAIERRRLETRAEWAEFVLPRTPLEETPAEGLARTGLSYRISLGGDRAAVILVVGGALWDFVLFHALAQMRPHVFWSPAACLGDAYFVSALRSAVGAARRSGGGEQLAIVSAESEALRDDARAAIADSPLLRGMELALTDWREVIPTAPMQELERESAGRPQPLLRHEGETQDLPTPVPTSVATATPTDLRWVVDVEIEGWTPARNAALAETVARTLGGGHNARVTRRGLSYLGVSPITFPGDSLESAAARPRVVPLPLVEQLRVALAGEGWTLALSDKGAYARQSARLFGGVDAVVTALRQRPLRAVLDAYLVPRESEGAAGLFLDERARRFLTYADILALAEEDAADLLPRLASQGVLLRGHVLKCEQCRGTSFYRLGDDERFRCFRCYTEQEATPFSWLGRPEPPFRYGLAEVVYQFLRSNGLLPLCAVFDELVTRRPQRDRFDRALDIAHELDFQPPAPRTKREHDIVVTWGGDLWLGEATATDRFGTAAEERTRFNRIAETAAAARARGVMFATTAPAFRASTVRRARAAFRSQAWPELRFVTSVRTDAA